MRSGPRVLSVLVLGLALALSPVACSHAPPAPAPAPESDRFELVIRALDERGRLLSGAHIAVEPASVLLEGSTLVTDASGAFHLILRRTPSHYASAIFTAEGRGSRQWPVPLSPDLVPHPLALKLWPAGAVSGRVEDSEGRPVPGAELEVRSPPCLSVVGRTDAEGHFTVEGVCTGESAIEVSVAGRPGRLVWLTAPATGVKVVLEPTSAPSSEGHGERGMPPPSLTGQLAPSTSAPEHWPTVQGQVVDPDGRPVTRFVINGLHFENAEGRFSDFSLPYGARVLLIVADGFAPERRVLHGPMKQRARLTEPIALRPGRTVRGRIVTDDGQPVPRAAVMIRQALPGTGSPEFSRTALSDANGRFELGPFRKDAAQLDVETGAAGRASVPIAADEDSVTVRLRPGAELTGLVRDLEGRPLQNVWVHSNCNMRGALTDWTGRYVLRGLGVQECVLSVRPDIEERFPTPPFNPRRVRIPERGILRVDLDARQGPATLHVETARRSLQFHLLEGDVPLPSTLQQLEDLSLYALGGRSVRKQESEGGSFEMSGAMDYSSLPLGRYTLFVAEGTWQGMSVSRLPVALTSPGTQRVEVERLEKSVLLSW